MEPTMSIEIGDSNNEKGYQTIKFVGEFDKEGHIGIRKELDDVVGNFKLDNLVFDFADLRFINSESIGYLIDIHGRLSEKGKKLILVGSDDHVKDVLKTIGMTDIIPMFSSMKDFLNNS